MTNKRKIWIYGVFLALVGAALFYTMSQTVITFDTAMNYQVSKHLADHNGYATFYHEYQLFDHNIQTGSPVIFPTAVLNMLFGNSTIHMQFITVLYLLLFVVLAVFVMDREAGAAAAVLGTLLILSNQDVWISSLVGFGEFSMAFWLLLFLLLFFRARGRESIPGYLLAGVCFGIGYLDKTVFLICLPACALFFCYDLAVAKKAGFRHYLLFALGALAPIFLFELYRFNSLGLNGYIDWWKYELSAILGEAGVSDSLEEKEGLLSLFLSHMGIYQAEFNLHPVLTVFTYLFPGVWLIFDAGKRRKEKREPRELLWLLYGIALTYIVWWMVITPTARAWARRIVVGHAVILLLAAVALENMVLAFLKNRSSEGGLRAAAAVLLFLVIGCYGARTVSEFYVTAGKVKKNHAGKQETEEFARAVSRLPEDARLYGFGWWQNPVIADLADRVVYDLERSPEAEGDAYWIVDSYMNDLAPETVEELKQKYEMEPVKQIGKHSLYRIHMR